MNTRAKITKATMTLLIYRNVVNVRTTSNFSQIYLKTLNNKIIFFNYKVTIIIICIIKVLIRDSGVAIFQIAIKNEIVYLVK